MRLISARFVPEAVTVERGSTQRVELEVSCDRTGLNTDFGRLGIQVQLDPNRQLPAGVTTTLRGGVASSAPDFASFSCEGPTPDPELLVAHIAVDVTGDAGTDRRFDLRLIAFGGGPDEMPTRYAAGDWLAAQTAPVITGADAWTQALVSLAVPAEATYLLFEIYAYQDVINDGEGVEFAGHYADDAALVLRAAWP